MDGRRGSLAMADAADMEKKVHSYGEPAPLGDHIRGRQFSVTDGDVAMVEADQNKLQRNLKGRHMQMIAM